MTLYSPLMWALRLADPAVMAEHLRQNPEAVAKGMEIMTENVSRLVAACKRAGVDGFYVSTQGGEAFRFGGTSYFRDYVKPTDLAVWEAIGDTECNILHVCDYQGSYDDLTPFLDYPGDIVNCALDVADRTLTPREAADLFGRPFMGGLQRKGVIATGPVPEIQRAAEAVLAAAPRALHPRRRLHGSLRKPPGPTSAPPSTSPTTPSSLPRSNPADARDLAANACVRRSRGHALHIPPVTVPGLLPSPHHPPHGCDARCWVRRNRPPA